MIEFLGRLDLYLRGLRPGSWAFWRACAVPALATALLLASARLPGVWRLVHGGERVEGVVVGTPCAGGPRFAYRFVANRQTFEGVGRVSWLGVDCSALAAGMHVPVYYLPDRPTVNASANDLPAVMKRQVIGMFVVGGATLLGVAGVLIAFHRAGHGARG